eukprot:261722_1
MAETEKASDPVESGTVEENKTATAIEQEPEKEEKKVEDLQEDDEANKEKEKEQESIYSEELPDRIIVGRNHPLSFYVDRARRVFRIETVVQVTGRGDNMATACKLVEALKRQKIASVAKMSTGMNIEPYFNAYGDARWGPPSAYVYFKLKRGELGEYIADYQQRKVIEIFENNDEECCGTLPIQKVESLQLDTKFKANEEQILQAKTFLSELKDDNVDLPSFIKYASILIHPLLRNRLFKEILSNEFNINVSGAQRNVQEEHD